VAYQILVIIMPEEPVSVVESERQGNTAVFRNSGTANYLLSDGVQCKTDEPENCVALQSRRIYPGNTWSLDLPFDGPASYKVRTHEGSSELVL